MHLQPSLDYTQVRPEQPQGFFERIFQMLNKAWGRLAVLINGHISFGDGTNADNIDGVWSSVTTPGVANTDFTVTHNLGRIPAGYQLMSSDVATTIYTGSVAPTTTQITLRSTAANAHIKLFIFLLLLSFARLCVAQTTVNLSVTDTPDNQTWNNGTWAVTLKQQPGTSGGPPFNIISGGGSTADQSGLLSNTGTATMSLPANSNIAPALSWWYFTVCPNASAQCYSIGVIINPASPQTVALIPPSIRINVLVTPPPITAYADQEISGTVQGSLYYNVTILSYRQCDASANGVCSVWSTLSIKSGPTNPTNCQPGQIFGNTSTTPPTLYICGPANTWSLVSAVLGTFTVGTLPVTPPLNSLAVITDGNPNCTVGGGATRAWCQWNGSAWVTIGGGGSGPAAPVNSIQKNNAGAFGASSITDNGSLVAVGEDTQFKGPNPYVDIRSLGARAIPNNVTPAVSGITATCNGTTSVVLSGTPTTVLQVGDGVLVAGCGAANPLSTPPAPSAIVPSGPVAETGIGLDVSSQTGAVTNRCYSIRAWNQGNSTATQPGTAITAASTETCTTNGLTTIGPQNISITSISCSGVPFVCTVTTSGNQTMAADMHFEIKGAAPSHFNGDWNVKTWTNATTFTFTPNWLSVNNGPTATTTGGTLYWKTSDRVPINTAAGSADGTKYLIYEGASGPGKNLVGIVWPQNSTLVGDKAYLAFDYYGSTYTIAPTLPYYVPTTDAAAATPEGLNSTIISCGGSGNAGTPCVSNTLVLNDAAVQSSSGNVFLFDDNIILGKAVVAAKAAGARVLIPFGFGTNYYVGNAPVTLPTQIEIEYAGGWQLNDSINFQNSTIINGLYGPLGSNISFQWDPSPVINCIRAWPCIYGNNANIYLHYLTMNVPESGIGLMISGGGGFIPASTFDRTQWSLNGNGYTSMAQVFASPHTASAANFQYSDKFHLFGAQIGQGLMNTPGVYFSGPASPTFDKIFTSGKGILLRPNQSGTAIDWKFYYIQGAYMPALTAVNVDAGSVIVQGTGDENTNDTGAAPCWLYNANPSSGTVLLNIALGYNPGNGPNTICGGPNSFTSISRGFLPAAPQVNNLSSGLYNCLIYTSQGAGNNGCLNWNTEVTIEPFYSITAQGLTPAAPTCGAGTAGGSVPVGNVWYYYTVIELDNTEGQQSAVCATSTTSGNQTVPITFPQINPAIQYNLYRSITSATTNFTKLANNIIYPTLNSTGQVTYSDTLATTSGVSAPTAPGSGPVGMNGGQLAAWDSVHYSAYSTMQPQTVNDTGVFANGAITTSGKWAFTQNTINYNTNVFVPQTAAAFNSAYYSYQPFTANTPQISMAMLTSAPGASYAGVSVNHQANNSYYACYEGNGTLALSVVTGGSNAVQGTQGITPAVGDRVVLINNLWGTPNLICTSYQLNGTIVQVTGTNRTFTTGSPGIMFFDNGGRESNWVGGIYQGPIQATTENTFIAPQHFRSGTVGNDEGSAAAALTEGSWTSRSYFTTTNCSSSAAPAVCGSAAAGSVVIAAGSTSVTVNTTAVTANSQIILQNDDSLGTKLGVTCNTTINLEWVSARTAATSFVITTAVAPAANPECISYFIVN